MPYISLLSTELENRTLTPSVSRQFISIVQIVLERDLYCLKVSGASGPPIFLLRSQAAIMFRCRADGFR